MVDKLNNRTERTDLARRAMSEDAQKYINTNYATVSDLYAKPCQNWYCNRSSNALIVTQETEYIYCSRCLYNEDLETNVLFKAQIEYYY